MREALWPRQRPGVETVEPRILFSAELGAGLLTAEPWMAEQRSLEAVAEVRHEIVFVDERLPDVQQLIDGLRRSRDVELEVVWLRGGADGVGQISDLLAQRRDIDAVHIVSHGEAGALQLGGTRLDAEGLVAHAGAITHWREALSGDADLLLYGCAVAQGSEGRAFVGALSRLTGADVAASDDLTGATVRGGDWVLEFDTGGIVARAVVGAAAQHTWGASLGLTPLDTETRVNGTTSGTQSTHQTVRQVAIDAAGNFVVVWNDSNSNDVYGRRFAADGSALGNEFRINTFTTGTQDRATVAMDAAGNFVVAWQSANQDGSGYGVYAQRYDAAGVAQGSEFRVNQQTSGDQNQPSVAMDAAGGFLVSWSSSAQDGSGLGVYVRRYDAGGNALGNEARVNATTSSDQQHSSVAVDASGNVVVVWQSSNQDGSGFGIYGQRFDAAGTAQGGEFRVNTTTANDQDYPSLAMAPNGDFVVLWSSAGQDGSGYGAYAQRYNAAGVTQGGEFRVTTNTSDDQDFPVAAVDSRGNLLVTWESYGQDAGGTWGIYSRLFDSSGMALTGEVLVNTTTAGDQEFSSLAWNGSQAVFVWSGSGTGDGGGVFFRRADAAVAGITVTPTAGLTTTEALGSASFDVALTSQPTADVTISIASSDTTEGAVSMSSLTFTAANWNLVQTVTVSGVDDAIDDGDVAFTIVTGAAASGDADYNGMSVADVTVSNVDDDAAGVLVSAISGDTTEAGGTATFGVALTSQPTADVTISIASSDATEGSVSTSSLTFTAANWNAAQVVTVSGVNDDVDDDNVDYSIVTGVATSGDAGYNGLNAADVTVSNVDNDTAGITASAISGNTTEAGGAATFSVALTSQPTADVTIAIASSDATEGSVSTSSLTFTAANWNVAQLATVTGVDDALDDGDAAYSIITGAAASVDGNYNGMGLTDVALANVDDDNAGITVSAISGSTIEAGGTTTFSVALTSQPTADVTISIVSNDTSEATVSPSSLTFTAANWSVAQVVSVTGVDDAVDDGDVAFSILTGAAISGDANYNGLNAADVAASNVDNDTAGVIVSAVSGNTTEAGGTATFSVVLDSQPTADVTMAIASNDTSEGAVSPSSLSFTATNWNMAQTVVVTGVNDDVADGDAAYLLVTGSATSADANYHGMGVADVTVSNVDDDVAGITVSANGGNTTEAGGTASFSVALTSQPLADVMVSIASSDTTEGSVSTSSLIFTTANWHVVQVVTVAGVDDAVDDSDIGYSIVTGAATSMDANYNGMSPADVALTNTNDDTAGVTVSAIGGNATEASGTATFGVALSSQPTADLTIAIASSNPAEGTVSTSSLTFTAANWNVVQAVTVTGVDDAIDDGDVAFAIVTGAAASGDADYNGMGVADVAVSNVDDDTAGITVSAMSGNTTEAGGAATFSVALTSQPTTDVTLSIASSDTNEGTVSVSSLTFTAANWNVAQIVTVTGVADGQADGDTAYRIVTGAATSDDGGYSGLDATDPGLANLDADQAPIVQGATQVTLDEDAMLAFTGANALSVLDVNDNWTGLQLSVGSGQLAVGLEGGAVISAGANDSGALTISGTPEQVGAALASLTYRAAANANGADALMLIAFDDSGLSGAGSVQITIEPVNDAPTISAAPLGMASGGALVLGPALLEATDPDDTQAALVYAVSEVAHGQFESVLQPGVAISHFSGAELSAGQVRFQHTPGAPAPSFVVTVSDGGLSSQALRIHVALADSTVPDSEPPPTSPVEPQPLTATPAVDTVTPAPAGAASIGPVWPILSQDQAHASIADDPPGVSALEPTFILVRAAARAADYAPHVFDDDTNEASVSQDFRLHTLLLRLGEAAQLGSADDSALPALSLGASPGQEDAGNAPELATVIVQTLGVALTAGSVWWALRVGGLLTSLLAAMPAWRQVDPLPVLADDAKARPGSVPWGDAESDEEARDEEAVAYALFSREGGAR